MLKGFTRLEDRRAKEAVSIVETDKQASRAMQIQAKDQALREVKKGEEAARTQSKTQLVRRSAAHFSIPRVASPAVLIMQIRPRVPLWSTTIRYWIINSTPRLARLLMEWKYPSISWSLQTMLGQEPRLRCTKIRTPQWRPSNTWTARKAHSIAVMLSSRSLVRSLEATQTNSTYPQASTPSQNPRTSSASQTYPDMQTLLNELATLERVSAQTA